MKECRVKMDTTASEIQIESKNEKETAEVSPQDERHEGETSMLCFKRRKKAAKAMKIKADSSTAAVAKKDPPKTGVPDQSQPPGGTWTSFKRLVTHKKRSDSSKKLKSSEAELQPEINAEDADLPKKRTRSRLKIPCIKFSKGEKRSHHSKIKEDSDCNIKVEGETKNLVRKIPTQPDDQVTKPKSIQHINEDASRKDGNEVCESDVSNSITSGEKVISVELGLDTGYSTIQTETQILEKDIETNEEKQRVQLQQANPPETSETEHKPPMFSDVPPSPIVPDQQITEVRRNIPESGPIWKDHESREVIAEESKPKHPELSQESDVKENEINTEKPKPKHTELSQESDVKENEINTEKPKPKHPELSQESDVKENEINTEKPKPKHPELSQESDVKENEINTEKPKPEENKRMEPIAIIITDTEISEFDVKKSKNVPKQFLISIENEQVGIFTNDSGFEGRTSEYETLLMETASSLVKNAIQLSIEQLVNEMASNDNKINNLLQ
ncbi:A-kinase anchor protein 5 [Erinaceus europaeus]|uniref:A-kinase anchor protein 5 n=1 Tax=Erinaceus europaeus TaxID=9365 RepID=A0ABM3W2P8_ERIEU|nr:A-kinase anchor protein 5 [Erinaceus europaeus]